MTIASAWLDGWVSGYIAAFRVKSDKSATESFEEYEAMRIKALYSAAESKVSALEAVVEAALELDKREDFSEPLGPGQDPVDWDGYNACRKRLGEALVALPPKEGS